MTGASVLSSVTLGIAALILAFVVFGVGTGCSPAPAPQADRTDGPAPPAQTDGAAPLVRVADRPDAPPAWTLAPAGGPAPAATDGGGHGGDFVPPAATPAAPAVSDEWLKVVGGP